MPTDCISYQNSGYFSSLMNDYLDEKTNLQSLYNRFPTLRKLWRTNSGEAKKLQWQ